MLTACSDEKYDSNRTHSKVRETQETQAMLAEFRKQEHRFELNGCEFKYNGESFKLGSSTEKIKNLLGDASREIIEENGPRRIYFWNNDTIQMKVNDMTTGLYVMTIELNKMDSSSYVLVEGVPLNNKLVMASFIGNSNFKFEDFYIGNTEYKYIYDHCNQPIEYLFFSDVNYTYIGDGHARLKDKIDFEKTGPVRALVIYYAN
jgi:hypothetical protein